jgi:hypothetical protein
MKTPIVLASAVAVVLLSGRPLSAQQRAVTRSLSSNVINPSRGMSPDAAINPGRGLSAHALNPSLSLSAPATSPLQQQMQDNYATGLMGAQRELLQQNPSGLGRQELAIGHELNSFTGPR